MEAKPASPQDFSAFLLRWQHLSPQHRLRGQEGVREVIRQIEAHWLPYAILSPDILARRVADFRVEQIDDLCLSGEFLWVGQSSDPNRAGSIAFLAREGFPLLYPLIFLPTSDSEEAASGSMLHQAAADEVRRCLERRGASFLIDIAMDTGLDSRIVHRILWEMIWTGEVTGDRFGLLRSGAPPVISMPERSRHTLARSVDRREFYRTRARIAKTFSKPSEPGQGRWVLISSLLCRPAGFSDEVESEGILNQEEQDSIQILARVLLERYGIVARDLVRRPGEPNVPWSHLYDVYQRMELSGEIERGYFVEGLAGAQFGLPEAVDDLLGRMKVGSARPDSDSDGRTVLVNSCDPAYLFSASGPFDAGFGRINRLPSNYAVLQDGAPIVTVQLGSGTLGIRKGLKAEDLRRGLTCLRHLVDSPWPVRPYRRVELTLEGLEPEIADQAAGILREAGFEGGPERLVLWRSG